MNSDDRSTRFLLLFWAPLAAQWLMMGLEGPFLAAVIARLADPKFNLAAYGVAYALAILVESPVIMLMSAATALVEDSATYRRLRNFANALNLLATALLLLVLVPPVYTGLMETMLGLPPRVSELVRGSLWILLPWPAAIGYRRFLHGVLIRSGLTRRVAYGTVLRLAAMGATALLLAGTSLPGAWVGAAALSVGVVAEALAARVMAAGAVRALLDDAGRSTGGGVAGGLPDGAGSPLQPETGAETGTGAEEVAAEELAHAEELARAEDRAPTEDRTEAAARENATTGRTAADASGYGAIARFYYPLALTSLIGLTVQPLLTFFMGRAPGPLESLAVFPVVHALTFLFRSIGLSFQEAAIALLGPRSEHAWALGRFGAGLALASSAALGLVAFTPLSGLWYGTVSGLSPGLAAAAVIPTRVLVPLPALSVLLSFQRAILVQERNTRPITVATAVEVVGIALLFPVFGWGVGLMGVTSATLAFLGGRIAGVLFLLPRTWRVMAARRAA